MLTHQLTYVNLYDIFKVKALKYLLTWVISYFPSLFLKKKNKKEKSLLTFFSSLILMKSTTYIHSKKFRLFLWLFEYLPKSKNQKNKFNKRTQSLYRLESNRKPSEINNKISLKNTIKPLNNLEIFNKTQQTPKLHVKKLKWKNVRHKRTSKYGLLNTIQSTDISNQNNAQTLLANTDPMLTFSRLANVKKKKWAKKWNKKWNKKKGKSPLPAYKQTCWKYLSGVTNQITNNNISIQNQQNLIKFKNKPVLKNLPTFKLTITLQQWLSTFKGQNPLKKQPKSTNAANFKKVFTNKLKDYQNTTNNTFKLNTIRTTKSIVKKSPWNTLKVQLQAKKYNKTSLSNYNTLHNSTIKELYNKLENLNALPVQKRTKLFKYYYLQQTLLVYKELTWQKLSYFAFLKNNKKANNINILLLEYYIKKTLTNLFNKVNFTIYFKYNFSKLYYVLFLKLYKQLKPVFKKWRWKAFCMKYLYACLLLLCYYDVNTLIDLFILHFTKLKKKFHQKGLYTSLQVIFKQLPYKLFNIKGFFLQLKGKINTKPRKQKLYFIVGNLSNQSAHIVTKKVTKNILTRWGSYGLKFHIIVNDQKEN